MFAFYETEEYYVVATILLVNKDYQYVY